ncbi:MAG TPA: FG-GAP-like repeat-containing protein [Terriglobales bacterium]|nr:FG-GAP-like repeat-containing protein [Terriglobales bacterium]
MCSLRVLRLLFASLIVLVAFNPTSSAQTFSQKDYSAATPEPGSLAKADLNHDGFADILNTGGTDIFVLLNNGDGTFRAPVPYAAGGNVGKIMVADVNGDSNPDVVYSTQGSDLSAHISILYGNGDGTFGPPKSLSQTYSSFSGFDLADFNRDGKIDLVIAHTEAGNKHLTVLFGDGTSFSNPREFTGIGKTPEPGENDYFLTGVAAGDFNGDGNPDIAIGEGGGGTDVPLGSYSVFYGKGDGTFGSEAFEGGESGLYDIKTVNVNNDGIDDLAVFYSGCHTPCNGIDLVYGNSAGLNHGGRSVVPLFDGVDVPNPNGIVFADINGDGRPDVIAAGMESHDDVNQIPAISVNIQQSDGSFSRSKLIELSFKANDLVAGDFNRDGEWDFVSSNQSPATISVFTNTTAGIGCAAPSSNRALNVCVPANGSTVTSPVLFRATARTTTEISGLRIYVDGVSKFLTKDAPLTASLIITPGTHSITVKAWDAAGPFSKTLSLKVSGDSGSCQPASSARAVTICSPKSNDWQSTLGTHFTANANGKNVKKSEIYIDGTLKFTTPNFAIDTTLTLAEGTHKVTVKGWDDLGSFSTSITVPVYGGSCKPAVAAGGRGLTVCNPKNGASYSSDKVIPVQAIVVSPNKITSFTWQWANAAPQTISQSWLDIGVSPPVGHNTYVFKATDAQGTMSQTVTILVTNASCPAPTTRTVVFCSPQNGQTVQGSFVLNATAGKPSGTFKQFQIYKDGAIWFTSDSQFINISTGLPAGTHRITAKGWDSAGSYSTTINVTSTGN